MEDLFEEKITEIKLVKSSEGDWSALLVNGINFYEGHSIPEEIWLQLFVSFGVNIEVLEQDCEDIEFEDIDD